MKRRDNVEFLNGPHAGILHTDGQPYQPIHGALTDLVGRMYKLALSRV